MAMNYILQTEIAKHRLGREGILITRVRLMQVGLPVLVKWLLGEIVRKPSAPKTASQNRADIMAKAGSRCNISLIKTFQIHPKWRMTDGQKEFSDSLGGGKVMTLSFLKDGGCYVSVCIFYIFYFNLHICRNYAA